MWPVCLLENRFSAIFFSGHTYHRFRMLHGLTGRIAAKWSRFSKRTYSRHVPWHVPMSLRIFIKSHTGFLFSVTLPTAWLQYIMLPAMCSFWNIVFSYVSRHIIICVFFLCSAFLFFWHDARLLGKRVFLFMWVKTFLSSTYIYTYLGKSRSIIKSKLWQ